MSDASVVCSNLSFSWPDGTGVFASLSFVFDAGRTGLVAANGAGKTTLLELIAERYRSDGGGVSVRGALAAFRVRSSWSATTWNSWLN